MIIDIPLFQGFALKISDTLTSRKEYPTTRLQKGVLLVYNGQPLDEEGVGFGVPVLKCGLNTLFPGAVELTLVQAEPIWEITAKYTLNLTEKIAASKNKIVENRLVYWVKNFLAAVIRRVPLLRGLLTSTSNNVRKMLNWETTYALSDISEIVEVVYRIQADAGKLTVAINPSELRPEVTEVVMMNEQGARCFDQYSDSAGNAFQGEKIGCWDEVKAERAWFKSSQHKIAFTLAQIHGAQLFSGRELIGSRLAWAGFGYSFPASIKNIHYEIRIEQIP